MKTATGIGAAAVVGGYGFLQGTQGARATGGADYGSATVTSDDGSVEYVAIFGDSIVKWDGFDTPAASFQIVIDVEVVQDWDGQTAVSQNIQTSGPHSLSVGGDWGGDGESYTIGDEDTDEATAGTIKSDIGLRSNGNHNPDTDWAIIQASDHSDPYGLPNNPVPASDLTQPSDGNTRNFTVKVKSTYEWYDSNENLIFDKTFTSNVDLSVTNEEATATGSSGSGDDGATAS